MRSWPSRCRSIRDLLCTLILVIFIFLVITYQVCKLSPQIQKTNLDVQRGRQVHFLHSMKHQQQISSRPLPGDTLTLESYLRQLEEEQLRWQQATVKVAVVRGDIALVKRDLPLYASALKKAGFTVNIQTHWAGNSTGRISRRGGDWTLLLCMVTPDDPQLCLTDPTVNLQQSAHRVNHIPTVTSALWKKEDLCSTMNNARHIPALKQSQLSPLCFNLPQEFESFVEVATALGEQTKWVLKVPATSGGLQLVQPLLNKDLLKLQELRANHAVVQQYLPRPLLLYGQPFSIQAYVLVTSVSPLQAYMYVEGLVQFRHDYQHKFQKVLGKSWNFVQFHQYLSQTFGKDAALVAWSNMESVIIQTLLTAETTGAKSKLRNYSTRCLYCFQLLEFDLIFNSSFHPIVADVSGQPDLRELSSTMGLKPNILQSSIIDDLVSLVFSTQPVAPDVATMINQLSACTDTGIKGISCDKRHKLCLSEADLRYLLTWKRATRHDRGFRQIYPSLSMGRYTTLVNDLFKFSLHPILATADQHNTQQLHGILTSLTLQCHSQVNRTAAHNEANIPVQSCSHESHRSLIRNIFFNTTNTDTKYKRPKCSEEPSAMALLQSLHTDPPLNLTPTFDPRSTDYYASVLYETLLLKVWGFAISCNCEARLEDKYGLSRPSNLTLGLGENKVIVVVVDITHTEPRVVNTYTIHVHRHSMKPSLTQTFNATTRHSVCYLVQECELPLSPGQPCGLQRAPYRSWSALQGHMQRLALCTSTDLPARWVVPCGSCKERTSCYWHKAIWLPYTCRHPRMHREKLRKCLVGKQVLFIGDSTNRGILHYIIEQVNGSLTEYDKTHDMKVYNNINSGQTVMRFAYYPQFWLSANERPSFYKSLNQLLRKSLPLEDSSATVLVIGGVHWLSVHHINIVHRTLARMGLQQVKLIVKGLGAGFHQPVDGLHCLTLSEHRRVAQHNRDLMNYAARLNIQVVDTFNMTMARYRDFLQGKCACHFHRVKEMLPSITEMSQQLKGRPRKTQPKHIAIQYHVDGEINAAYSEMVANQMCDYHG